MQQVEFETVSDTTKRRRHGKAQRANTSTSKVGRDIGCRRRGRRCFVQFGGACIDDNDTRGEFHNNLLHGTDDNGCSDAHLNDNHHTSP